MSTRRRPRSGSSQRLRIEYVLGGAVGEIDNILERGTEIQFVAIPLDIAEMRGGDHIVHFEEGRVRRQGFGREHIEASQAWSTLL